MEEMVGGSGRWTIASVTTSLLEDTNCEAQACVRERCTFLGGLGTDLMAARSESAYGLGDW